MATGARDHILAASTYVQFLSSDALIHGAYTPAHIAMEVMETVDTESRIRFSLPFYAC